MTPQYYLAFCLDRDITDNQQQVIVEAGIDLLAGPFSSREAAQAVMRATCQAHPRLAVFAALAAQLMGRHAVPLARIEVIPITAAMVADYNACHGVALPWPPPILSPDETNQPPRRVPPRAPRALPQGAQSK
jgi:hypothetical protein